MTRVRTGSLFEWNPENLIKLRKATGIDASNAGSDIGLSNGRLIDLESGEKKPTVDDLIKISKYYNVTINYILGLDDNPGECVPTYEKYIARGGKPVQKTKGFESPWPFNLYEAVFYEPIDYIPNDDQIAGMFTAISTLNNREQLCITCRFQEGLTLDDTSKKFDVGRERVRQIERRAVRKLRHPSRSNYMRFGKQQYEQMLKEAYEASMNIWMSRHTPSEPSIVQMNLSTRSYNCLRRGGYETLSQVVELIENGSIFKVRNLGKVSCLEILDKVNELTGSSYKYEDLAENYLNYCKK